MGNQKSPLVASFTPPHNHALKVHIIIWYANISNMSLYTHATCVWREKLNNLVIYFFMLRLIVASSRHFLELYRDHAKLSYWGISVIYTRLSSFRYRGKKHRKHREEEIPALGAAARCSAWRERMNLSETEEIFTWDKIEQLALNRRHPTLCKKLRPRTIQVHPLVARPVEATEVTALFVLLLCVWFAGCCCVCWVWCRAVCGCCCVVVLLCCVWLLCESWLACWVLLVMFFSCDW